MRVISYSILFFILIACSEEEKKPVKIDPNVLKEQLLEANKKATAIESNQIDAYVKRRKLNVTTSPTGLRYEIYHDEEGEVIKTEQQAIVKYKVSLLDGTECYSTKDAVEEFTVGKDYVESGLHEGITYMSKGDKAIIVIPSHLAHGLAGDFKKIPIRSTIIYDIELVNIK